MEKNKLFLVIFIFYVGFYPTASSQEILSNDKREWFVNLDFGVQMSGIKDEDFIKSNYSPLIRVLGGKWFNKVFGSQIGYQGRYFNAISDNDKHFYDFYFIEGVIDAKNLLLKEKNNNRFHELIFHAGFGLFQNRYYGNSSFHGILGVNNNFSISENILLKFDIGAIVGWDIYQGNNDILPSVSLGFLYYLK